MGILMASTFGKEMAVGEINPKNSKIDRKLSMGSGWVYLFIIISQDHIDG